MLVESFILLKEPPTTPPTSRDVVLGDLSDGVLIVESLPAYVELGVYLELVRRPDETGEFDIELFLRDHATKDVWMVGHERVAAPPADSDWSHPLTQPLTYRLVIQVPDLDEADLWMIVTVNGEPAALKTLFLRPGGL